MKLRLCSFATALLLPLAAHAGMEENCVQSSDPDLSIGGCTAMIRSGEYESRNLAVAYTNRGNAHLRLSETSQAIADYDQAIRLDPDYPLAYNGRGLAYRNLGEDRRAITDFSQAIRLDPQYDRAYKNRGIAYEHLGGNHHAMRDYETAMHIGGSSRVKTWQKYLAKTGFYDGAIDGKYGPKTRAGLLACTEDPDC